MNIELEVTWDGDVPGLAEHRLSLERFGEPLALLLQALRRTVSNMVVDAMEAGPERGARGGRLAKMAKSIDLELVAIKEGSACLSFRVNVPEESQYPLFPGAEQIPRGIQRFMDDLEGETRGELRSGAARKYLASLPVGLTTHKYTVRVDGRPVREVSVSNMTLAEVPEELPSLQRHRGKVVAVTFEPAEPSVTIATEDGKECLKATGAQVEKALLMRHKEVLAQWIDGAAGKRLLWLRDAERPYVPWTHEAAQDAISKEWDGLLRRLA